MAKRRSAQPQWKQPKQRSWWSCVPDWEVVVLPPVAPLDGWREYFGLVEAEKAAA